MDIILKWSEEIKLLSHGEEEQKTWHLRAEISSTSIPRLRSKAQTSPCASPFSPQHSKQTAHGVKKKKKKSPQHQLKSNHAKFIKKTVHATGS